MAVGGEEASLSLVSRDDMVADLRRLGVAPGDGLFVHGSVKAIAGAGGHVVGGPRAVILALLEAAGPGGLVAFPGFTRDAYAPDAVLDAPLSAADAAHGRRQTLGYDPATSSAVSNGALAETFRTWPGVVRSAHPTSSVLMRGPDAARLAEPHDPHSWPTGPDTPWARLAERPSMKILLLGVGWNRCSALHAAESAAACKRQVVRRIKSGPERDAPWFDAPDVADDLGRLFPEVGAAWERDGAVAVGRVGRAESRLTDYGPLVAFARDWIDARNRADGVATD